MMLQWQKGRLVIQPGGLADASAAAWIDQHREVVFRLRTSADGALMFVAIGPEPEACRVPINITSKAPAPLNLISNFAKTPFVLDGRPYASVEGFWQGLKFPAAADRERLAALWGSKAKDAGFHAPPADRLLYADAVVAIGTFAHWELMERACAAKFAQNDAARRALLSTGRRPLVHATRPDSRTIPGVILAAIWMRIREQWREEAAAGR